MQLRANDQKLLPPSGLQPRGKQKIYRSIFQKITHCYLADIKFNVIKLVHKSQLTSQNKTRQIPQHDTSIDFRVRVVLIKNCLNVSQRNKSHSTAHIIEVSPSR